MWTRFCGLWSQIKKHLMRLLPTHYVLCTSDVECYQYIILWYKILHCDSYVCHAIVITQVQEHCLICLHNTHGHGQVQTYQTMQKCLYYNLDVTLIVLLNLHSFHCSAYSHNNSYLASHCDYGIFVLTLSIVM